MKIGGKGMKGFYGSPTEGSLGIVGNVAKSLFKQEPKTIDVFQSDKLASGWSVTTKDVKKSILDTKFMAVCQSACGSAGITANVLAVGVRCRLWNTKHSLKNKI